MEKNPFKKAIIFLDSKSGMANRQAKIENKRKENQRLTEFGNSIIKHFLNIDVKVMPNDNNSDSILECDESVIFYFNFSNKTFVERNNEIIKNNFTNQRLLQIIENIFTKISNKKQDETLSENETIALWLNLKVLFIDSSFKLLLEVFKNETTEVYNNDCAIIIGLKKRYETALLKENKINCFETFNFAGKKLIVSKETSDKYCREIIKILKDKLNIFEPENETQNKSNLKGFQSSLTLLQKEKIFKQLKGSYIDKNTNPDHFKAIFKNEPLWIFRAK